MNNPGLFEWIAKDDLAQLFSKWFLVIIVVFIVFLLEEPPGVLPRVERLPARGFG